MRCRRCGKKRHYLGGSYHSDVLVPAEPLVEVAGQQFRALLAVLGIGWGFDKKIVGVHARLLLSAQAFLVLESFGLVARDAGMGHGQRSQQEHADGRYLHHRFGRSF